MISDRTRAGIQHKIRTAGYKPGPQPKLKGKSLAYAKRRRRRDKISVPRIRVELLEQFGIEVSDKTLYNVTAPDHKGKR